MKDFLFFASVYGAAASLAILTVGSIWRAIGTWADQRLFPYRWTDDIPADRRGGALRTFVHCPACISFWVGVAFSLMIYSPSKAHFGVPLFWSLVVDGLSSVGIIWCVHVILTRLGQYDL
jgi:hypothetical protein